MSTSRRSHPHLKALLSPKSASTTRKVGRSLGGDQKSASLTPAAANLVQATAGGPQGSSCADQ